MDMDAANDELIAKAIAALPYRRPSAGFALRVMAEIAVAPRAEAWQGYALKTAGLMMAAWAAGLGLVGIRLVYSNLPEIAAFFIQPGAVTQALGLLAARAALIGGKLEATISLAGNLAAAAGGFPAYHERIIASLVCGGAVYAVSHGHAAAQRI